MYTYVYTHMYTYIILAPNSIKLFHIFFSLLNRVRYYYFFLIVYQLIYKCPRFRYMNNPYSHSDSSKTMRRFIFFHLYRLLDYKRIHICIYVIIDD